MDQVWVVPCFQHPFRKELAPFPHRLAMCRLAFADVGEGVKILEVEERLGGVSYTIRTVEHLHKQSPGAKFFLIVGADTAQEATRWERYDDLSRLAEWLVFPRGANSPVADVSATAMREALAKGTDLKKLLPEKVVAYIGEHHLYGAS